jgi:Mg2+-importing ATPase
MNEAQPPYWSIEIDRLMERLSTTCQGLSGEDAEQRLRQIGPNRLRRRRRTGALILLLSQFKSPITLLLLGAAVLSIFLHDASDAAIILFIVIVSALLGFWQEKGAANALAKLLALVSAKLDVLRDGRSFEVPVEQIVPGDVVILSAGSMVPGDCRIITSRDLFVNEAALTGETFPVEKCPGVVPAEARLSQRANCLFYGTHVVSGTGTALVIDTAMNSEFGRISKRLELRPPETEFEQGVRRFGYFLMEVTLLLILAIFAINVWLHRPVLEAFLFSLALAVGLTPQLLPAIISVNLAHGARRMATQGVIVRRLSSIENFGSIDVLCSDKTGTLTEGVVRVQRFVDALGHEFLKVLELAYVNASFESGFANPIDDAVRHYQPLDLSAYEKLDEIPYDFVRKRLSILVRHEGRQRLITKGSFNAVLACCESANVSEGHIVSLDSLRESAEQQYKTFSEQGLRVLGVAFRDVNGAKTVDKQDETGMVFVGLLVLHDPLKQDVADTVARLRELGVSLKIVTGDNHLVASYVADQVGLQGAKILKGAELSRLSDEALRHRALETEVFAEVEPNQKERIILALKKGGQVVGYIGDGINDATALHAADVGISVDQAVDVAKEAADLILLKHDLRVLEQGIREGRATFANTLKYVFMATSANFGNMFSMAGASLFLPFLPLLPKQILLMNLLTDFPEMTIATDSVDRELTDRPRRWDVRFIRNFMLVFGPLSSIFDFLTFVVLLLIMPSDVAHFRTGWFLESVISATLVVLVVRTRRPFIKSRPSLALGLTSCVVIAATLWLPYSPFAEILGFHPISLKYLGAIGLIVAGYTFAAELTKRWFYRRIP